MYQGITAPLPIDINNSMVVTVDNKVNTVEPRYNEVLGTPMKITLLYQVSYPGGGGGGGTSIIDGGGNVHAAGQGRTTGYDFPVITIETGYLNRPNWLLRATPFITGLLPSPHVYVYDRPAISAPATVRAGRNRFL